MLRIGFSTYIVTNKRNGTLYTGHTDDLAVRGGQHLHGVFDGFKKTHGCKYMVWFEEHETRHAASTRERQIKKWNREWKLNLIERFNPHWVDVLASPVWPLPDPERFPDLYEDCLRFALPR